MERVIPMDYQKDLAIDPHNLAEEWLNQPILFMRYSEELAHVRKRLSFQEEKVKIVRSRLIKEAADKAEGGKSADLREAYYRTHKDHIEAKDKQAELEFEANLLESAVFAFNQRKVALENLVKLFIAQYFAGPREPQTLPEGKRFSPEVERADKVSNTIRKTLQRRR